MLIRLCKKGTSKNLRIRVFWTNLSYLILFTGSVLKSVDRTFIEIAKETKENPENEISLALKIIYVSSGLLGVFMTLIKGSEPYILESISCKKKKKVVNNESLCTFVNSAMNIEYVYLILVGINNFLSF